MKFPPLFFSAILSAILLQPASAAVIVNNLGEETLDVAAHPASGQSFTMPAGTDYSLDQVSLYLAHASDGGEIVAPHIVFHPLLSDTFAVSLYSDSAGLPGSQLAVISAGNPISGIDTTPTVYNFTPSGPVSLLAGQTYWIVLTQDSDNFDLLWRWTNSPSSSGIGSLGGPAAIINPDDPWVSTTGFGNGPLQLSVTATAAVPEPATFALLAGAVSLGFITWRRSGGSDRQNCRG